MANAFKGHSGEHPHPLVAPLGAALQRCALVFGSAGCDDHSVVCALCWVTGHLLVRRYVDILWSGEQQRASARPIEATQAESSAGSCGK